MTITINKQAMLFLNKGLFIFEHTGDGLAGRVYRAPAEQPPSELGRGTLIMTETQTGGHLSGSNRHRD